MKIVSIIGSPRGTKGNTAALVKILLEGAKNEGAITEIICIRGRELRPCKACDTCHRDGACPQKDGFNSIKEKVLEADGIVLASPNYIVNVSAQLKAFLDRCCGLVHCQSFENKYGASVVTSGGGEEEPIAAYLNDFLANTGAMPVGAVWATMGNIQDGFPEDIKGKAYALGKKLVNAWRNKESYPEFARKTLLFTERMRYLMIRRKEEWPYEYNYWKKYRGLKE